jgi:hypothetical protein
VWPAPPRGRVYGLDRFLNLRGTEIDSFRTVMLHPGIEAQRIPGFRSIDLVRRSETTTWSS